MSISDQHFLRYCDEVIWIDHGSVFFHGDPAKVHSEAVFGRVSGQEIGPQTAKTFADDLTRRMSERVNLANNLKLELVSL